MPSAATAVTRIWLVFLLGACATESSADEPEAADSMSSCSSYTCSIGYMIRASTTNIKCSLTTGNVAENECSDELCCQALWWQAYLPNLQSQHCNQTDYSTLWSECSYPWDAQAGLNQYLPVAVQWFMCAVIWAVAGFWLFFGGCFESGCCESFVKWGPVLLIVPGHLIFFGFVSHFLRAYDWLNYAMNFVCLLVAIKAKVGVPYMLGAASYVLFLLPVLTGMAKRIVHYDYGSYSMGVAYPSGVSNAVTFLLVRHGYMTNRARWLLQSFGWCALMSGMPIYYTASGQDLHEYQLNLVQFIRYSAYQLSIYIFMFYGLCNHLEPHVHKETGHGVHYESESEVPTAAVEGELSRAVEEMSVKIDLKEPLIQRPPGSLYSSDPDAST